MTNASKRQPPELYLDLLKRMLIRWGDDELVPQKLDGSGIKGALKSGINRVLANRGLTVARKKPFDPALRENGRDWPALAETMIGLKRLDNLQHCIETVIRDQVPGDFVETGVWRGGASIFAAGAFHVLDDGARNIWCADSFQGLPAPDLAKYPQDKGMIWHEFDELSVGLDTVKNNFRKYGLLDERVRFLPGWFKETLPAAPIDKIAVLRLDGDMYESTIDALEPLYGKVSVGGFVIVDDYGLVEDTCRRAIHDFRSARGIADEIIDIDGLGAYWRKSG